MDKKDLKRFSTSRLDDRQTSELIGIARGVLADGKLCDVEIEFLYKWLVANEQVSLNPVVSVLYKRVSEILSNGIVNEDERQELFDTLTQLTGNDFVVGEILKATTLPLDDPAPDVTFLNKHFCFTGTFVFGSRRECEAAVESKGGSSGGLAHKTDFLVIGEYATDSWQQSSFGRKIERAIDLKGEGFPVAIISEPHWRKFL